jgi:hypothetical protein
MLTEKFRTAQATQPMALFTTHFKIVFPLLGLLHLSLLLSACWFNPSSSPESSPTSAATQLETTATSREDYTAIALDSLPANVALVGTDPVAIALTIWGRNPEEQEGAFEQTVDLDTGDADQPVVTITHMNLSDDSVRGMRYRVEFEPTDTTESAQWQIVWVGRQQICWQGRGAQTWTTELCL